MIAIINYGTGNVKSIQNALNRIGTSSVVTNNSKEIMDSDKIILPGVGAFDSAINRINDISFLQETLKKCVSLDRKPILGICLGMQIMGETSDEGSLSGLQWINGCVRKIAKKPGQRVPRVGWMKIQNRELNILTHNLNDQHFYFSHSYSMESSNPYSVASVKGSNELAAVINKENIWEYNFTPKKVKENGLKLLQNFVNIKA